jgi:hypothetical protein
LTKNLLGPKAHYVKINFKVNLSWSSSSLIGLV